MQLRLRHPTPELEGELSPDSEAALAAAYDYLRIWIGLVAITLPIILVVGNQLLDGDIQGSISAYYYTKMHAWFIGSQFVLGVFFLSYNYRPLDKYEVDNVLTNVAFVAMIIVGVIPTKQPPVDHKPDTFGTVFHLVCAGAVFALLAYFSYRRFTKSSGAMTDRKRTRNTLFKACGIVIAACLVLLLLEVAFFPKDLADDVHPTLVLESIAIFAFGVSWLVKGGFLGILADR